MRLTVKILDTETKQNGITFNKQALESIVSNFYTNDNTFLGELLSVEEITYSRNLDSQRVSHEVVGLFLEHKNDITELYATIDVLDGIGRSLQLKETLDEFVFRPRMYVNNLTDDVELITISAIKKEYDSQTV